jgi:hypothetical protein
MLISAIVVGHAKKLVQCPSALHPTWLILVTTVAVQCALALHHLRTLQSPPTAISSIVRP